MRTEVTQELLREVYEYRDGKLYFRIDLPRRKKGSCASWVQKSKGRHPRNMMFFEGGNYYLTKMVYLYHTGKMASRFAYIDGNTLNDRIENIVAFHKDVVPSKELDMSDDTTPNIEVESNIGKLKYDCCIAHESALNKWEVHVFEPNGALTSHGSFHTIAEAYAVWKLIPKA